MRFAYVVAGTTLSFVVGAACSFPKDDAQTVSTAVAAAASAVDTGATSLAGSGIELTLADEVRDACLVHRLPDATYPIASSEADEKTRDALSGLVACVNGSGPMELVWGGDRTRATETRALLESIGAEPSKLFVPASVAETSLPDDAVLLRPRQPASAAGEHESGDVQG